MATTGSLTLGRRLATCVAAGACLLGSTSCSGPSKGALVVAISTDMQTPKDFNVVSVFVSTDSVPKYDYLGRVRPDGSVDLPATIAVVEPDNPKAEIRIRVVAFNQADAKVLRDVKTTVPHQRTALLRMPLNFLDVGSVKSGGIPPMYFPNGGKSFVDGLTLWDPTNPTDIVPTCDFTQGLTMVNGACAPLAVDSDNLPDYSEPLVFGEGGLQPGNMPGSCFDVARCFAGATPVMGLVTSSSSSCSFPLPAGTTAANLNVALVTPGTGTCLAAGSCYVPLPNDKDEGWSVSGSNVQLAAGVCAKLGTAGVTLAVSSGSCAAQTLSEPVCEPLSGDASVPDSGPTEAATNDAEAGAPDAGPDAPGDATVADTGALDATVDAPAEASGCTMCGGACVDITTNVSNCGGCGISCAGICAASHCQVTLFTGNDQPKSVALDSTYVYWSDVGNGAIMKAPKAGGNPVTMVSTPLTNAAYIAIDSKNLYYQPNGNGITAAPLDGSASFQVVANYSDLAFVADGANLYWAEPIGCPSDGGPCESAIVSQPLDGGAPTTLANGNFSPVALAVTDAGVYWTNQGTTANSFNDGTVMGAPLDGGAPMTIATAQLDPHGIAADSVNVYWASGRNYGGTSGSVVEAPLDGGLPNTLATNLYEPSAVAIDSTTVYFSLVNGGQNGSIGSVPIDGGGMTTISSDARTYPDSIAVDSTNVYWAGGANVERVNFSGLVQADVFAGVNKPNSVVASAGTVYAAYQPGSIFSIPTDGGVPALIAAGLGAPQGMAINPSGSALCWSEWANSSIVSMSVDGGVRVSIASGVAAPAVAVSAADNAYWWDSFFGHVDTAPLDAGAVQPVAVGYPSIQYGTAVAVDSANVYFTWEGSVDGGPTDGEVLKVPFVGGTVTTLASGRSRMAGITVAGGTVYWADSAGILSVPAGGGTVSTVASDTINAYSVVVDSTSVYWTDSTRIQKASLDGGTPVTLVPQTNTSNINGLAVDPAGVYWVNPYLGTVSKVTPK
jgi:sugar lactone lactonase YvrE